MTNDAELIDGLDPVYGGAAVRAPAGLDEKALAKVKALEWEPFYTNDGRECAETPLGETYHVSEEGWWNPLAELHECDGKEAAKAAAQADYERRILSALELAPAEAEGWQPIESAPKDGSRVLLWHRSTDVVGGGFPVFGSWRDYSPGVWSWRSDSGLLLFPEAWTPSPPAPAGKE